MAQAANLHQHGVFSELLGSRVTDARQRVIKDCGGNYGAVTSIGKVASSRGRSGMTT